MDGAKGARPNKGWEKRGTETFWLKLNWPPEAREENKVREEKVKV